MDPGHHTCFLPSLILFGLSSDFLPQAQTNYLHIAFGLNNLDNYLIIWLPVVVVFNSWQFFSVNRHWINYCWLPYWNEEILGKYQLGRAFDCDGQKFSLLQRRNYAGAWGRCLDTFATRIDMYTCQLSSPIQTREIQEAEDSWVSSGQHNSVWTYYYLMQWQLHGFPLCLCRASSHRRWTGCRTGPKKPRSFWCSCATWSSRSRYRQPLRQKANPRVRVHPCNGGVGLSLLFHFYVLWGNSYLFTAQCLLIQTGTHRPAQNITLLEGVTFAKPDTAWFSKWFLSSSQRS